MYFVSCLLLHVMSTVCLLFISVFVFLISLPACGVHVGCVCIACDGCQRYVCMCMWAVRVFQSMCARHCICLYQSILVMCGNASGCSLAPCNELKSHTLVVVNICFVVH